MQDNIDEGNSNVWKGTMDTNRLVELAIAELERQRARINADIDAIQAELKDTGATTLRVTSSATPTTPKGRKRTAAEKKAQSQKMKEIWAARKAKAAGKSGLVKATPAASTKSRTMSEAQRKALSLKMKEAWRKRKAAAKTEEK